MRLVFDHGTILVREPPLGLDLCELLGVLWDPRVKAYRAPAYHHRTLSVELLRRGIRFSDEVRRARPLTGTWQPIELRPYQDAALCAWELAQRRARARAARGALTARPGEGKRALVITARDMDAKERRLYGRK